MKNLQMLYELLRTLPVILLLYLLTVIFSVPLGVFGALLYTSKKKIISKVLSIYIWIFRGTPLMLQLFIGYYALPILLDGNTNHYFSLDAFSTCVIVFILNYTAYLIEIFRSGIETIEKGQEEAAQVLGYTYFQKMFYIILPQSIRRVLPSLGNEAITLIKDTSLMNVLAITELIKRTRELTSKYYNITPYIYAILIYLVLSFSVDRLFKYIEAKNKIRM